MSPQLASLIEIALVLSACTGGAERVDSATDCSVEAEKVWLRGYMADWYLWAGSSPNPEPEGFATVEDYFHALLFTGNAEVPADRWSSIGDATSVQEFYDQGQTMGYGLFVNSQGLGYGRAVNRQIEVRAPLHVRFIEEQSPAASAGLKRGDNIVSINGQASADIIAVNDFAALTPESEGDVLEVVVDDGSGPVSYSLVAGTYTVTPVPVANVLSSVGGIQVGYLVLSTFSTPAAPALREALDSIREQGASELIVDLRYDSGGRTDIAALLASMIAGAGHEGKVFARLTYNRRHRNSNQVFYLSAGQKPAFKRVLVLTGPRTCSSSELVVNGLRPFVDVVTLGSATCGKPFGFDSEAWEHCGSTYQAASFESVNSLGEGQYYDGIVATCPVEDDLEGELGSPTEKLTAAALSYLDSGGTCPSGE